MPRVPWAEKLPRGRGENRERRQRPSGTSSPGGRGVKAVPGFRARRHSGAPGGRNGRRCVTGRGRSRPHMACGKAVPAAKPGVYVGMRFALAQSNRLSITDCRASEGSERRRAVRFPPCKPTNLAHQTSPTKTSFHKYPITGLDRKPLAIRPPATAGGFFFVRRWTAGRAPPALSAPGPVLFLRAGPLVAHCFLSSSLRNSASNWASSASRHARSPYSRKTPAASTNCSTSLTTSSTSRFQV